MVKVRCKQTNADSFLVAFFMTRKYKNHFLRKLSEIVIGIGLPESFLAITRVKVK